VGNNGARVARRMRAAINTGGVVMYNCSSVYYRPFYQGTTLVYQVVTYP
jgi:hypothetical protein